MTFMGKVKDGLIVLEPPAGLPDGTVVRVETVNKDAEFGKDSADDLSEFIGAAKGLPSDFARNHDHYIHGCKKRE